MISPPLRFLTVVIGGWVCLRGTVLASAWWGEVAPAAKSPLPAQQVRPVFVRVQDGEVFQAPPMAAAAEARLSTGGRSHRLMVRHREPVKLAVFPHYETGLEATLPAAPQVLALPAASLPPALLPARQRGRRWSMSSWLFVRNGAADGLAPDGSLGGSQAGARMSYRLNGDVARPLALSIRAYAPMGSPAGAEVAAGVDWKPLARLPLHVLAERRQALGREGRSAFSLTAYGGISDTRAGPLLIDAYAQAGAVGAKSRDLFADGSVRLSREVLGAKVGAGAWGAAQPGVARLDAGPQASLRLSNDVPVTVAVDWRFRVAGDAAPKSGPTLTISTDF